MTVQEAIEKRRAYRALASTEISDDLIKDLAHYASLAPSCRNKQPWRYIFIKSQEKLQEIFSALPEGNNWALRASLVIAVYSRKDYDCVLGEREYYLFDTGMATAFLILRATELGLVAHPIAGYNPQKAKEILGLEQNDNLIGLIIVGKHSTDYSILTNDWQKDQEHKRPQRMAFDEIAKII